MRMEAPPSRYRVVERDGRLVVIDNGEELEPLVRHSHEVVTPAKRRARDRLAAPQSTAPARTSRSSGATGPSGKPTINLPIGPDGASQPVEITGSVMGRVVSSVFGLMLLFVFGGPFLILGLIVASAALGAAKPGGKSLIKRLLHGWARWIASAN